MVWFWNGDLKTRQKKCLPYRFYMSRIWMVSNQTIWKPDKKVSEKFFVQISGVGYSDGYCIALGSQVLSEHLWSAPQKINFISNSLKKVRLFFNFFKFLFYFICRCSLKFERSGNTELTWVTILIVSSYINDFLSLLCK